MFRKSLQEKLENIFGIKKTTFDAPSDQFEQDVLFIGIQNCFGRISGINSHLKIAGSITLYSQVDKLPYGFFQRRIEKAAFEDKKDLFFLNIDTDLENSPARMQNIHERRCDFVFLYSQQLDPNKGEITSLEISES